MSFWKELSRRNVIKVGIAYAVAAWLIIHPVDIIFPILHLPEWSITLVAAILIILFPLVLIFSWVYEVTPKGLKKTKEVPASKSITHLTGKRLNYIITGLLVLVVVYFVIDKYFIGRGTVETKQATVVTETPKTQKTIAVLPFEDLSPAKDQEYFVDGLSEEILNSLTKISDIRVIARTSSFSFKGTNKTAQEIASVLGADHILEGSVRKAGNALRITAQLIKAADGTHLWSETYDRELKDIFAVQENIAIAVANELKATLGIGKSLNQLGGTNNLEAYELYLVAKGLCGSVGEGDMYETSKRALESIDAAIALDPKFAPAWAVKATLHVWIMAFGPAGHSGLERDEAIRAAQKAIELEPNLAEGYVPVGYIKMSIGDWIAAEAAFQKALELETEYSTSRGMIYISLHYISVGNFKKAHELLEKHRQNDPLDMTSRGNYMITFVLLGNPQKAEEEFNRCRVLFGDQWGVGNQFVLPISMGGKDAVTSDDIVYPNRIFDVAKANLASPEEAIKNLRRIFDGDQSVSHADCMYIALWAAWFGDSGFAMDAMERGLHINASGAFWVWMPVFHEVRQTPRFKSLIKKIGLVDYWNKFGWPDICHQLDNGDFECD